MINIHGNIPSVLHISLTILLHWFNLSLNGTGRWSGLDGGNKDFAINTSFSQCAVTIRFPSEIA